jgi:signal transduction histidine kinase
LRIEITGSRLGPGGRGRFFTLGEVVVLENGRNAALGRPVRASSSTENGPRWQARNLTDGFLWCEAFAGADESPGNGYHSRVETTGPEGRKWVEVDLGEPRVIDTITLIPARPPDFADVSGFGFPPRFRVVLDDRTVFESGPDPFPNPGSAAVQLPVSGVVGRRVRLEAVELWRRTGDYLLAMAELEVWSGPENVALGRPVTGLDNLETGRWKAAFLTDGFSSQRSLLGWKGWLDGVSARIAGEERQRVELAALEERRTEARERWIVFSGTAAVVAALLGVIALMWQRRQAEREREALRVRIAQDLHDEIGASLSHLALQGDLAAGKLGPEHPVHGRLVTLAATARETLGTMRDLVWLLAPVAGTWREFCLRLTEIGERLGGDFVVDVSMAGDVPSGGPAVAWAREIVLFFKEVLTNARRHSGADGVEVLIRWGTASFTLVVRDRGCGFDPDDPSFQGGAGLRSLRARAARLRGRCEIRSEAGAGTTVVLQAPLLN